MVALGVYVLVALSSRLAEATFWNGVELYSDGTATKGVFRADPILAPGNVSGHAHEFFGSGGTSPGSTYATLMPADGSTIMGVCTTNGQSTNRTQVSHDKSAYWHPALYMERKDGGGFRRIPTGRRNIYYKDAGHPDDTKISPFEFPAGFRMIAGSSLVRQPPLARTARVGGFGCGQSGEVAGFYRTAPGVAMSCPGDPPYYATLHFPHCFNRTAFDAQQFPHTVYPEAADYIPDGSIALEGRCPAGTQRVPHIEMKVYFDINAVADDVVPNTFVLAHGDRTGHGWHGDFMNGWKAGTLSQLLTTCYTGQHDIGGCPFETNGHSAHECSVQAPQAFVEEVERPARLPGCNPPGPSVSEQRVVAGNAVVPIGADNSACTGVPYTDPPPAAAAKKLKERDASAHAHAHRHIGQNHGAKHEHDHAQ